MYELLNRILDDVRGSWRFRVYALLTAWAVCLLGWTYIFFMPDIYESSTRIYVDTRTVLRPVIQGLTVEQDVGSQLNFVRNSLLSRPNLERVAGEIGLFGPQHNTPGKRIAVIEAMAERIELNVQDGGRDVGMLYSLKYKDQDRERSLRVVQKLIGTFMDDTRSGKRDGAEMAQKFLREQIDEYEVRLRQSEERLAEFKKRNVGLMPGTQGDYFTRLQAEMALLEQARGNLSQATSRRAELSRQLRGDVTIASVRAPSTNNPTLTGSDTGSRILDTQKRLDELLLRFTEKHPDVLSLRETLHQLESRRDSELADLRSGKGALPASAASNPVVQSIQLAINQADVDIVSFRNRIADAQSKVEGLQKLVDTAPEVEADFARLNRDYDVTRQQYNLLVERSERARLGDQAEQTQSVRFEIIDPPAAQFKPIAPRRLLLVAFVLVIGLGAGGVMAFLLHQLKPVFNSTRTLNELTGLPVLGIVSKTWLDRRRFARHRELITFSVGIVALVLVCAVMVHLNLSGFRLAAPAG